MATRKILVIGGVAGGASCAARCRRLDERAEIVVVERGPFASFANCGLPYYVGDVIPDESHLLVATPELFRKRFNIEVRTRHEALRIDRERGAVEIRDLAADRVYRETYDALVLAPGAAPVKPPLPGIDLPGIFVVRTIPDARAIRGWIGDRGARSAVVVGAGFIGLEMAENLVKRGLAVTVLELLDQVMPPLDPEMARPVQRELERHGVRVFTGDGVAGFAAAAAGRLAVLTAAGARHEADLMILAIGVRPEIGLAKEAGLALGERGGIKVDDRLRTSDPRIWAVGDAVETRDAVTGAATLVALAGPANRQGRIAAEGICGRDSRFRGVQATAICGVFDVAVASTGATEKALRRAAIADFAAVYLHPNDHAGYYPGARPLTLKLIYRPGDGRVLGAQAVGAHGVDKRIDVIATVIQLGGTVHDLAEAELCYAPQFGAAKDPVNLAGMIAANALAGDQPVARWEDFPARGGDGAGGDAAAAATAVFLLDVRDPGEFAGGHVAGATNIPLGELRGRLAELPGDREIWVYCGVGQRAYYATRILRQHGLRAKNLAGGLKTRQMVVG